MAGGRDKGRRVAAVVGGWGYAAAALSLTVMVGALSAKSEAVALVAGAVFILATVLALVGHIVGDA